MSEDYNSAIVRLQLHEGASHSFLCLGRALRDGVRRRDIEAPVERNHIPAALQSVQRFVHGHSINPAEETVGRVVAVERCECITKRGLRYILCILHVAQHTEGDVEHTAMISVHQLVTCGALAVQKSSDQCAV